VNVLEHAQAQEPHWPRVCPRGAAPSSFTTSLDRQAGRLHDGQDSLIELRGLTTGKGIDVEPAWATRVFPTVRKEGGAKRATV